IFVDNLHGNDAPTNAGSKAAPYGTLGAAIAHQRRPYIFLAGTGPYNNNANPTAVVNASIVGGLSSSWTRVAGTRARITTKLLIGGGATPVVLESLDVSGGAVTTGGGASQTAVEMRDCDV